MPRAQLHAHTAGWQANAAFGDFHAVYSCDQYTFAALFDAHTATEVADFCKRNCVDVFLECLVGSAGDPRLALRSMFKELDASFFNSEASPLVREWPIGVRTDRTLYWTGGARACFQCGPQNQLTGQE